ncbi:MAG: IS5 family transposase [Candidatus Binatia bacterium]
MRLTDAQWAVVEPLIPRPPRRADGRGRPRQDDRAILDGILWIMRTGAQWDELPKRYPPKSTCHDRFQAWNRSGVIASILKSLADDLVERGELDLSECFVDATFAPAKRGAPASGPTKRGKGTTGDVTSPIMAITDAGGLPVAVHVARASPHETTLVETTLEAAFASQTPVRLIGDRAYDSDPLDERLRERGIEMIAPHRKNRTRPKTQDGRKLRRYRRRWKVERLFAWLQNFRRIQTRHECYAINYLGMVQLGCLVILLRMFFG